MSTKTIPLLSATVLVPAHRCISPTTTMLLCTVAFPRQVHVCLAACQALLSNTITTSYTIQACTFLTCSGQRLRSSALHILLPTFFILFRIGCQKQLCSLPNQAYPIPNRHLYSTPHHHHNLITAELSCQFPSPSHAISTQQPCHLFIQRPHLSHAPSVTASEGNCLHAANIPTPALPRHSSRLVNISHSHFLIFTQCIYQHAAVLLVQVAHTRHCCIPR